MTPYFDYPIDEKHIGVTKYLNGLMLYDTKNNDPEIIDTLFNLFSLPYSVYLLDMDGSTIKINSIGAELCGFHSPDLALGKTIFHVSQGNSAQDLLDNCQTVLKQEAVKIYDELNLRFDGRFLHFLSIKFPCYDNHCKLQGVLGISIALGEHPLAQAIMQLTNLGLLPKTSGNQDKALKLNLGNSLLTPREHECLDLTVKGFTAKEIAQKLKISPRTVEEYLNQLKLKFAVTSKQHLIQKVLS